MKINLQIEFQDETKKDITCNAADLVAFEIKFNVSISKLSEDGRIGWLLFLAWHSEHRTKNTSKSYEEWIEDVSSIGDSGKDPK